MFLRDKIKQTLKEQVYEGYLSLNKYTFKVPPLDDDKTLKSSNVREVVHSNDSVHILIYSALDDALLFCEEFRTGSYLNQAHSIPFLYQCVSGSIESDENPIETALKEILEETGLTISALQSVGEIYKSPGILTEMSHLFFTEYDQKISTGIFGVGDEEIKTHLLSVHQVFDMMDKKQFKDGATLLLLNWFRNQYSKPIHNH